MDTLIIFGAQGMLGRYIHVYFNYNSDLNVIPITRQDYDVLNDSYDKLEKILSNINNKTVIFNSIGLIPQKNITSNEDYIKVNVVFPYQLACICNKYNAKLIHPSTDCVFSGKDGNYNELSIKDASDMYGISKKFEPEDHTIIRTSIIGEELKGKKSLLEWVKSNKNNTINGYSDHYWNGITCLQYARIVKEIIVNNLFWKGVRHIYSPSVSKYELIKMINEIYDLNITINDYKTDIVDKTLSSIYPPLFNIPNLKNQITELSSFNIKDI